MFNNAGNKSLNRDHELSSYLKDNIKRQNIDVQISSIEAYKQILSQLYQNASSYTNLVILAGYAGIFTVWQITKDLLSGETTKLIGLLITSSLMIFVSYEVLKMITQALFFKRLGRILEKDIDVAERMVAWELAYTQFSIRQLKAWPYFLIPTILLGFIAGVILLYHFSLGL